MERTEAPESLASQEKMEVLDQEDCGEKRDHGERGEKLVPPAMPDPPEKAFKDLKELKVPRDPQVNQDLWDHREFPGNKAIPARTVNQERGERRETAVCLVYRGHKGPKVCRVFQDSPAHRAHRLQLLMGKPAMFNKCRDLPGRRVPRGFKATPGYLVCPERKEVRV